MEGGEEQLKIVCISDTHGKHKNVTLPEGDILIHAGDITNCGEIGQLRSFAKWFAEQPFRHKFVIAGNHDVTIEKEFYEKVGRQRFHSRKPMMSADEAREILCANDGFIYLEDEAVVCENYKIYGSPWTPEFGGWAFGVARGRPAKEIWKHVPNDIDILVTHGPPHGKHDLCFHGKRVGCEELMARILTVKPLLHVFGHVHEGRGVSTSDGTTFVNASSCNLRYRAENEPIVITLPHRAKSN